MENIRSSKNVEPVEMQPLPLDSSTKDAQSYLVSKYREALEKGDKDAAKSCLLEARYFTVDDPAIMLELYDMAKSDGDIGEASRCFAHLFNVILSPTSFKSSLPQVSPVELNTIRDKLKEEMKNLKNCLKSKYLKFISKPVPNQENQQASSSSRPVSAISDDEILNRRLTVHLSNTSEYNDYINPFYQQLFDKLSLETKENLLVYLINGCIDDLGKCELMMLMLTIFKDSVETYGFTLYRSLNNVCNGLSRRNNASYLNVEYVYAKSLLVLDAIPLLLGITDITTLKVDYDQLFYTTLSFYSECCLRSIAEEYEPNQLHEGVKKSIAARILGTEANLGPNDVKEETRILANLNLLSELYLATIDDINMRDRLKDLRSLVTRKTIYNESQFDQMKEMIESMKIELDSKEDTMDSKIGAETSSETSVIVQPSKVRGRPKKQALQSGVRESDKGTLKKNQMSEEKFIYYSLLQYFYVNCSNYLKSTRSKILIDFRNPLAKQMEIDLSKGASQRVSRSKASSQQSIEAVINNPNKKQKLTKQSIHLSSIRKADESPLNSEQSRKMDLLIITFLREAKKTKDFLKSIDTVFKSWKPIRITDSKCCARIYNDFDILLGDYEYFKPRSPSDTSYDPRWDKMDPNMKHDETYKERFDTSMEQRSGPEKVAELRYLVQRLSCYTQVSDKETAFLNIDNLLFTLGEFGLLHDLDNNHIIESPIDEYMTLIEQPEDVNDEKEMLGFLFFDEWSIIRYCIQLLMGILKRCIVSSAMTDLTLGHTIVLSQFDWPKELSIYNQCISWIRVHKPKSTTPQCLSASTKFTYSDFFQYIKNPTIIEDFMALLCRGYTLDIKSDQATNQQKQKVTMLNPSTRSGKAITTRGVNKIVKEDLKIALVAQMRTSSVSVPLDVISNFIQKTLLDYLSTIKK